MFDLDIIRETRKALKKAKKEFVEEMKMRQRLIRHNTDFAMLEQFIQSVNNNPGLKITFTLKDGTVVELKTTHERQKTYTEILGEMNE
jgi:methionyl-tRNA formyltransferase